MKTATKLKDLTDWNGIASVYAVTPPMDGEDGAKHSHVVVSGVNAMFSGSETYIFPCSETGEVECYMELPGSLRGTLAHADALRGAGYEIIDDAAPAGPVPTSQPSVAEMVNRFLGWPLPKTFGPDCGISFDGRKDDEWNKNKSWPVGTNLLTADEAKAMFEHCLSVAKATP